jgi:hypothetical protein
MSYEEKFVLVVGTIFGLVAVLALFFKFFHAKIRLFIFCLASVFGLGVALYDPFVYRTRAVETIYNSLLIWLAWSAPLIVHLLWYKIFSPVKQDDKS